MPQAIAATRMRRVGGKCSVVNTAWQSVSCEMPVMFNNRDNIAKN
jgi:hypothetical protein